MNIAQTVHTVCTRINSEIVPVTSFNKYLHYGTSGTGRQKNSCKRSVIKDVGRSWNELRFLAADRQKWKGLIDNLCS